MMLRRLNLETKIVHSSIFDDEKHLVTLKSVNPFIIMSYYWIFLGGAWMFSASRKAIFGLENGHKDDLPVGRLHIAL